MKSDVSEPGVPCIPEYSRGIVTRKAGALSRLAVGHLPVECTCPSPGNHHRRICPLPYLTANKTSEWVLNKAGVKRALLDNVKARKLAYYVHTTRKQGSRLDEEVMQRTVSGARRRGRPRTAWMDNTKTWTGLSVEESIRMTEDREKWRKYVHGVGWPTLGSRTAKEQNRTEQNLTLNSNLNSPNSNPKKRKQHNCITLKACSQHELN